MSYNKRRIRHVCSVKGCSNRDVVLISRNGHIGGVYLCRECASEASSAFEEKKAVKKAVAPEAVEEVAEIAEVAEEAPKKAAKKKAMTVPKDGE